MVQEFDAEARPCIDSPIENGAGEKLLLSILEFCERTGLSRSKTYLEISAGKLRAKKIGRRTVIPIQEANRWIEQLPEYRSADSVIESKDAKDVTEGANDRATSQWRDRCEKESASMITTNHGGAPSRAARCGPRAPRVLVEVRRRRKK